jgi:hypothetical protein
MVHPERNPVGSAATALAAIADRANLRRVRDKYERGSFESVQSSCQLCLSEIRHVSKHEPVCKLEKSYFAEPYFTESLYFAKAPRVMQTGDFREGSGLFNLPGRYPIELEDSYRDLDSHHTLAGSR